MFSASVGQWSSQFVPPDSGGEGDGGPVHSLSVPLRVLPLPGVAKTQEHCRTVQHQTAGEETRYVERGKGTGGFRGGGGGGWAIRVKNTNNFKSVVCHKFSYQLPIFWPKISETEDCYLME